MRSARTLSLIYRSHIWRHCIKDFQDRSSIWIPMNKEWMRNMVITWRFYLYSRPHYPRWDGTRKLSNRESTCILTMLLWWQITMASHWMVFRMRASCRSYLRMKRPCRHIMRIRIQRTRELMRLRPWECSESPNRIICTTPSFTKNRKEH